MMTFLCVASRWDIFLFEAFFAPRVTPSVAAFPPLTLSLKSANINDIGGVRFYSETRNEYLWWISISEAGRLGSLTYGVLPTPRSRQVIPAQGPPRPLQVGEKIIVEFIF